MDGETTLEAMRLFVALLAAAVVVALVVRRIAIPYTVGLVLLGLAVAFFVPARAFEVTPELVLAVLLPGLVFEASYKIELDDLRRTFGGIALLAAPGVILSAAVVAIVLHLATGLDIELGFVVGAMVAATDPAAVIATFRQLGTPRRLATLVEGESLFNDGTGLVVFAIAVRAVQTTVTPTEAVASLILTVVVSVIVGAIAGWLASRIISTVDDHLIELTISVVTAYGTYLIADYFHESGVIATVVAGVVLGNYGRGSGMSVNTQEVLDVVWEFLAFLLTALVFLLVGLAISVPSLFEALPSILWGVVAILVGRALVVYGLLGGASRLTRRRGRGREIPTTWLHVMFWAGLRGAVAVAMALALPLDFPQRDLLQEITFGVVLFTLLVQGTTVEVVVGRAAPDPDGDARPPIAP
jgi:CPA1 family monovalent cation:H+ antiporter